MKGQSLIEVLVALGIISIVITGIATIVTQSLSNTQYSKDQDTATKYAQEGLETVRNIRDNDYNSFGTLDGLFCMAKDTQSLGNVQSACTAPNVDHFIRQVRVERNPGCSANVSQVTVTVSWADSKCTGGTHCHKSELISCLSRVAL